MLYFGPKPSGFSNYSITQGMRAAYAWVAPSWLYQEVKNSYRLAVWTLFAEQLLGFIFILLPMLLFTPQHGDVPLFVWKPLHRVQKRVLGLCPWFRHHWLIMLLSVSLICIHLCMVGLVDRSGALQGSWVSLCVAWTLFAVFTECLSLLALLCQHRRTILRAVVAVVKFILD
mmetsp:Transcript_4464/g.10470  ORF Transcript_4464/g.10470 Transcript_4464/m.10470 type:complete len:172 (+) Transcript_4464:45-560(+)